ncbi:COG4-domain-containing protein, partial [Aureobasidium melanogenum]
MTRHLCLWLYEADWIRTRDPEASSSSTSTRLPLLLYTLRPHLFPLILLHVQNQRHLRAPLESISKRILSSLDCSIHDPRNVAFEFCSTAFVDTAVVTPNTLFECASEVGNRRGDEGVVGGFVVENVFDIAEGFDKDWAETWAHDLFEEYFDGFGDQVAGFRLEGAKNIAECIFAEDRVVCEGEKVWNGGMLTLALVVGVHFTQIGVDNTAEVRSLNSSFGIALVAHLALNHTEEVTRQYATNRRHDASNDRPL